MLGTLKSRLVAQAFKPFCVRTITALNKLTRRQLADSIRFYHLFVESSDHQLARLRAAFQIIISLNIS